MKLFSNKAPVGHGRIRIRYEIEFDGEALDSVIEVVKRQVIGLFKAIDAAESGGIEAAIKSFGNE